MGSSNDTTDDRGRTRRRIVSAYSWTSRARWLAWLFASPADTAVTIAALALIGGVGATAVTQSVTRPGPAELRMTVEPQRVGEYATVYGIEGRDEAGRRAAFDLVVLDKRFDWVRGSTTELVRDGKVLTAADIRRDVLGPEVTGRLAGAIEIIAVGAASQEGDLVAETHRAGLRARQTAEWVAAAAPKTLPIHTLNLGQYREPCAECETADTSWQRPFIIVAVRSKDSGTDVAQALAAAMSGKTNLPSVSAYSTFGFTTFR